MKIAPDTLKNTAAKFQLLDVRLPDDYEAAHLTGAKSNCVLEVDFLSRLPDSAPDLDAMTVIYGINNGSHEAEVASEKLARQGYSNIHILEGGFEAASTVLPVEKGQPLPEHHTAPDGRFTLDLEESRCEWTGRNLLNKHSGTVEFSSGHLDFKKGELTGGEIILNMKAITCSDLEGTPMHQVLIDHFESDDFFDVGKFPTVTIFIKKIHRGTTSADVTIKGKTHGVEIITREGLSEEGFPVAQASCFIDRTKWGVIYGSKKFFHRLAGHFVHDEIELDLRIVTKG